MAYRKCAWGMCLVLLFLFGGIVSAQVTTGIISGVVQDSSGAVVPHAMVTVRQSATALNRSTETDDEGRYRIPELPLGDYEVEASLSGFATETHKGVTLTVGRDAVVNITLTVGGASQSVSVTGEAPLVETTSASVSYLVDDTKIRELPLNGRDYTQLALLQPGVVATGLVRQDASTGKGAAMSISGAQTNQNVFLLDGQSISDGSGMTPGSAAGTNLGIDAIQEFSVITTNYSAEYGLNVGAVFNVVTRSGTNSFHGSAFEFLRNSALDAKNYFDLAQAPIPAFKRNQFGGTVGGPIIKDKTFFFSAYEGLRQRQGQTIVAFVPDAMAHQGFLPVAGVETFFGVNPDMASRLGSIPLPNGADVGDGTGKLTSSPILPAQEDYLLERIDHRFSNNNTIFARYVLDRSTADEQVENLPITRSHDLTKDQYFSLNWTTVISPNLVNVARASVNRSNDTVQGVNLTGIPDSQLTILAGQTLASDWTIQSPSLTDGQIGLGGYGESPRYFALTVFELADNIGYTRGRHNFKFGVLAQRYNLNNSDLLRPALVFQSLQQFLQGNVFQYRNFLGSPQNSWQQYLFGWYAQDEIRLSKRITVNIGVRHEFTTDPNDIRGKSADLRNFSDATVTDGPLFTTPKGDFAPRGGLAWDVFGNGKTAVRAGAGIYHQQLTPSVSTYALSADFPFGESFSIFNPASFNLNPNNLPPLGFAPLAFEYNAKLPTRYQWSLNVQQQISNGTTLSVAYVGSRAVHLETRLDVNPFVPTILPNGTKFFAASGLVRQNPNWGDFNGFEWDGISDYESLQVNIVRRLSKGLQVQGAYTYSKDIDLVSNTFNGSVTLNGNNGVQDPENLAGERALSSNNMKHLLTANITYDLPFGANLKGAAKEVVAGWQVGGLLTFHTGVPFDIANGFSRSRDGQGSGDDRPNLAPGANANPTSGVTAGCPGVAPGQQLGTPTLYFDPCAFQLQTAGTYGDLGRNTVIGPSEIDVDTLVTKSFALGERANLQFRTEAFNLFNHPNFGNFNRALFTASGARNGSAGQFINTLTPSRQIQFGLKLVF